ncbi:MAG: hypothetical protein KFF73_16110 [Cyclobacteriaceae bacterium]|nr:hypothetical protein [Cyclobacteriaceae bacterium]
MENKKRHIYIHPDVEQVRQLHDGILGAFDFSDSIPDLLNRMAINLCEANKAGDPCSLVEIRNFLNSGTYKLGGKKNCIDLGAAREIMARQHGWPEDIFMAG